MQQIVIYVKPTCPYCIKAKQLLAQKGIGYIEVDITQEPNRRAEMIERANGRTTVPQIFIGDTHVGGCDDLYALEQAGKLDKLLGLSN
ncbi:MAG: grxC [Chlamydiales bacterium]|nr:grxC [Chlamydiales bacterium]